MVQRGFDPHNVDGVFKEKTHVKGRQTEREGGEDFYRRSLAGKLGEGRTLGLKGFTAFFLI